MTTATAHDETLQCLLAREIGPYVEQLRTLRYANETLQRKLAIAKEFAHWAQQKAITIDNLNSGAVAAFVARRPQLAKTRLALERAAVRMFLKHLRRQG